VVYHVFVRRIVLIAGIVLGALLASVSPAVAGPGCPWMPGVCPVEGLIYP
jgi:hypothetical protein